MRILVLAGLLAALLGSASAAQAAEPAGGFVPCADAAADAALAGSLCARTAAPVNYADPSLGQIELFVRKFPAQGRRLGQVWLVAGGPGESGATFYPLLPSLRAAFPGYDLMIPDHRGTGYSSRLCPEEEAAGSPGGLGLEGAEWATCFALLDAKGARAQAFTISNAARDLSSLMARHSGRGRTYLYGVSYGTQLVLRTMVVAPPARLDGIVLDSLVPPETAPQWDLSHRSAVVDQVGRTVLAACDASPACSASLGGSATAAMQQVVDDPALAALFPGKNPKLLFGNLLNSPDTRAMIPAVIAGFRAGDLEPLHLAQARMDAMGAPFGRLEQGAPSIPLVALISASEINARPTLTRADIDAEARAFLFTSSLPGQLVGGASAAYPRDAAFGASPRRLPPVLILQGDLDPKTPIAGARAQAALLAGAGRVDLVVAPGAPHFLLLTAPSCLIAQARHFTRTLRPLRAGCAGEGALSGARPGGR